MNILSFARRYFPSKCPICAGTALEVEITTRKVEFQCASCGAFEITSAARAAMKGLSQESREVWLSQARQQHSTSTIPLVACANEMLSHGASRGSAP